MIAKVMQHWISRMSTIFLLIINLMCYTITKSDTLQSDVQDILKLLNDGNSIKYDAHEDIVLVLGNTGSGKTTFTQFIAGNNDDLISKETKSNSNEFIIIDTHNRISNNTYYSKTTFPELVLDNKTNTAFYDCPGFSDTRGAAHDISATYFINKVTKNANRAKLVFIISYPSVRIGMIRHDFMLLVRHAVSMIKNIPKFEHSIALIVTKVDNKYAKRGKHLSLVSDQNMIENIADFLRGVKSELNTNISLTNTPNNQQFNEKAIKFIDILLATDCSKNYTKIGILRTPDEPGALSNITLLQNGKKYLEKIIYDNIKYVRYDREEDFHYTISADSQNVIYYLTEEIKKNIQSSVSINAQVIQEYYNKVVQNMLYKIHSFVNGTSNVKIDLSEAQSFFTKFNTGQNIMLKLVEDIKNITTSEELSNLVNSSVTMLNINTETITDNIFDILTQGQYLHFLQQVSGGNIGKLDPQRLVYPFQSVLVYLDELIDQVQGNVNSVSNQIKNILNSNIINMGVEIENHFSSKEQAVQDIKVLYNEFRLGHERLTIQEIAEESLRPEDCIQQIINYVADLSSSIKNQNLQNAKHYGRYFEFLEIVSNQSLTNLFKCAEGLMNVIKYLNNSQKWYKFLLNLYERLSEYEIQRDTSACKYLANKITKSYDNIATNIKLELFLKKCYPRYEYDNIKDITVSRFKLNSLKTVLNLTLNYGLDISCKSNELVIKGQYVKLSDVKNIMCNHSKFIEIFSLNKVFINTDLDKTGEEVQVSIMAPIWDMQGIHKIVLDGSPGGSLSSVQALSGISPGSHGEHGKPGLPGGPGGNFFGIGAELINAKDLTISANGGIGGRGQHGGDGANEKNGERFPDDISGKSVDDKLVSENWLYIKEKRLPLVLVVYNLHPQMYMILGRRGAIGGNGGHGGKGGNGGSAGNIFMFFNDTKPVTINHKGQAGSGGMGGRPGRGGKHGDFFIVMYHSAWVFFFQVTDYIYQSLYIPLNIYSLPGEVGNSNYNDINMKPSKTIKFYNLSHTINDYKQYLRENLSGSIQESFLREFLNRLENGSNFIDKL